MKGSEPRNSRNMPSEYDFSKGRRGKYARRYAKGTNLVALAPDVAKTFPDAQAVTEALRILARISPRKRNKTFA